MPVVMHVWGNLERHVPTAQLNAALRDAALAHPAPAIRGKPLKIYYCAQPATHPPLFVFMCNDPELVQASYARFLEHTIRSNFDFEGVPLTMQFRERPREERV